MQIGINLPYTIYQGIWNAIDWLYPPACGGCGKQGAHWCLECTARVELIHPPVCNRCGRKVDSHRTCNTCRTITPQYSSIQSWAFYDGPVRSAIHRLKYKRDIALGELLSRNLITLLRKANWQIELISPVPLSIARQAERGYNQAALLSLPVALGLHIPYHPAALRKVRDTRSQVGLSLHQRRENIEGAFWADPKSVEGKRVLVIDDVVTSGATLNECAGVLFAAGAAAVYGVTVAQAKSFRSSPHQDNSHLPLQDTGTNNI